MAEISYSASSRGNITPTATQSAVVNDTVNFTSTSGFTVYVYDTSSNPSTGLFGGSSNAIPPSPWPKTIAGTGVYILSTCSDGTSCEEQGEGPTRNNGTINVGNGR